MHEPKRVIFEEESRKKPYAKIHVNIDDILKKADEYTDERKPSETIFEGAATSDPIPVEP